MRYELGLERVRRDAPLRFGIAFHQGLEFSREPRGGETAAIDAAGVNYENCPEWADPTAWAVEREQLLALLSGHLWRYGQDNLEFVAVELPFDLPVTNPATGRRARGLRLVGKIDALVRLTDGRLAVLEYKTAGEEVGPESDYWLRLRCDGQISLYVLAARALGYDVATVLYDVTRKPTIRLRQNETPEAYGQRLVADIGERPDFYFQRREVPRLEDELDQCRGEVWQQGRAILDFRRRAAALSEPATAWFRNVGRTTCAGCEFADLCLNSVRVNSDSPPAGFQAVAGAHPEPVAEGA